MNEQQQGLIRQWYDQYFPFLFLFLQAYFRKRGFEVAKSEVEELVLITFLSLLERMSDSLFAHPLAFLIMTALSLAQLFLDRKLKRGTSLAPEAVLSQRAAPRGPSALERREAEWGVWRLMSGVLSQLEQTIVYKRVVEGYSYREIAAEKDMPREQYLPTLFRRAKHKLYRYLKQNHYDKPQS